MADLPSMDDILRDSERSERRASRRLGLLLVAGSLAWVGGMWVIGVRSAAYYFAPGGAFAFGIQRLLR